MDQRLGNRTLIHLALFLKHSLLEHRCTHSSHSAYGCLHTATAELSHCSGDHSACKYLLFSPLQKKFASYTRWTDVQESI